MLYVFNYINLDIRILHTLMYQVDLCYTDRGHRLDGPEELSLGFDIVPLITSGLFVEPMWVFRNVQFVFVDGHCNGFIENSGG